MMKRIGIMEKRQEVILIAEYMCDKITANNLREDIHMCIISKNNLIKRGSVSAICFNYDYFDDKGDLK